MRRRSLKTNTTAVGNVGTGEDDLITYSVPGSVLAVNGDYLEFVMSGTMANNANAKRIKIKFGATTILDTGASGMPVSAAFSWVARGQIIRTGATTQKCNAILVIDEDALITFAGYATAGETLSGAVTLKATGEATSNDDIIQETLTVKGEAYA